MLNTKKDQPFGKIRALVWPIYGYELKKLLPMLLILFLICFNYSILRNVKDTVVITASNSGAEVIPFIKVWVLLPMAFILTWIYAILSSRMSRSRVFTIIVAGFIGYFLLFAFVLYPLGNSLNPVRFCAFLQTILPKGANGFIMMICNWSYTLFYVMCELWSSIVMNILFWGFANEITRLKQASRFYGPLNIGSTLAAFVAGQTAIFFTHHALPIPLASSGWEQSFMSLILLVTLSAAAILLCFYWMQNTIIKKEVEMGLVDKAYNEVGSNTSKSGKKRLSLRESFSCLFKSKYLICLAVLVVGYNLSINLIEITWKSKVKEHFPNPLDFNIYLNQLTSIMGIISTVAALCIPFIMTRIGWTFTALITPVVMCVTAIGFFGFNFLSSSESIVMLLGGTSPLAVAVLFGSANNVLTKAGKYSVFDASKELAFIPLPKDLRIKGKAAIDGVGSRLGKSGSSFLQQGLLLFLGSLAACAPWIAGILLLMIGLWISCTVSLGKQFKALSKQQESLEQNEDSSSAELENQTPEIKSPA
jgi:AAA family ATP:ADP antiporter